MNEENDNECRLMGGRQMRGRIRRSLWAALWAADGNCHSSRNMVKLVKQGYPVCHNMEQSQGEVKSHGSRDEIQKNGTEEEAPFYEVVVLIPNPRENGKVSERS